MTPPFCRVNTLVLLQGWTAGLFALIPEQLRHPQSISRLECSNVVKNHQRNFPTCHSQPSGQGCKFTDLGLPGSVYFTLTGTTTPVALAWPCDAVLLPAAGRHAMPGSA